MISSVPDNLGDYYPDHYYSFIGRTGGVAKISRLRRWLRAKRSLYMLYGKDTIGRLISKIGQDYFPYQWRWFYHTNMRPASSILDVGCGSGTLLRTLRDNGFTNLHGVDPYIKNDIIESNLYIARGQIRDIQGEYDLVMFHHSLEHFPDNTDALSAAYSLCKPGGTVLIRIPVSDGYGWQTYREKWFALDAPRHLAIPSRIGLSELARKIGFEVVDIRSDSESVLFWGSELYVRGLPFIQPDGRQTASALEIFSRSEMDDFERRIKQLNDGNQGDLACITLRRPA